RVITEGLQFIKPGIEVKVKDADNAKPAGSAAAPAAAAGQGE
ncbi:MAG: efflux transporter periplasmic adaptor subunit, partial [Pseudomonas sp.]|nr:efflux transporter periplasmic adaptor subunit [Pseudomonas sp.]